MLGAQTRPITSYISTAFGSSARIERRPSVGCPAGARGELFNGPDARAVRRRPPTLCARLLLSGVLHVLWYGLPRLPPRVIAPSSAPNVVDRLVRCRVAETCPAVTLHAGTLRTR